VIQEELEELRAQVHSVVGGRQGTLDAMRQEMEYAQKRQREAEAVRSCHAPLPPARVETPKVHATCIRR
jgi:hypothetical protein